jgi:hypothetical protein
MRSARRALPVAAIALALACALAPVHALAHGGNPNFRSEIDSVTPPLPSGVSIEVLDYDSYLQLLDQHGHEVVLYGYDDEPYARIEKDGTVQVNENSPVTYLDDSRFETDVEVPRGIDPKAAPEWKTVDDSGTFIWHDHRMHWMIANQLPTQVKDKGEKTEIFDYGVPMKVDGKRDHPARDALVGRQHRDLEAALRDRRDRDRPRRRRAGVLAAPTTGRRRRRLRRAPFGRRGLGRGLVMSRGGPWRETVPIRRFLSTPYGRPGSKLTDQTFMPASGRSATVCLPWRSCVASS